MNYSKELFTQKLIEFFERHDPLKVQLVGDIVNKFNNHQEEVFKHLTTLYAEKNDIDVNKITNTEVFSIPPAQNSSYNG
jgi:hypothetical protein